MAKHSCLPLKPCTVELPGHILAQIIPVSQRDLQTPNVCSRKLQVALKMHSGWMSGADVLLGAWARAVGQAQRGRRSRIQELRGQHTGAACSCPAALIRWCASENMLMNPHVLLRIWHRCGCRKLPNSTSHALAAVTSTVRKGTTLEP